MQHSSSKSFAAQNVALKFQLSTTAEDFSIVNSFFPVRMSPTATYVLLRGAAQNLVLQEIKWQDLNIFILYLFLIVRR